LDVQGLCYGPDCEKLKSTCEDLGTVYSSVVYNKHFNEEILDCKMLVSSRVTRKAVSVASWERSFSKLKLILSYLQASMSQERLCDLLWLS